MWIGFNYYLNIMYLIISNTNSLKNYIFSNNIYHNKHVLRIN